MAGPVLCGTGPVFFLYTVHGLTGSKRVSPAELTNPQLRGILSSSNASYTIQIISRIIYVIFRKGLTAASCGGSGPVFLWLIE